MRPRRPPDPTRIATIATPLLAGAVTLLLSASAQAATLQQKVYKIFTTQYRGELAYSTARMQANLTTAQTKLAATASSIYELSSSNLSAATALVDELENQYDAAGAQGIFKPALTAFTALSKLPLKHSEHKDAVADEAYLKRVLAINTPADLASWQAAGFATASEPADTKAFGRILGLSLPWINIPVSASHSAVKRFVKLENQASKKTNAVFTTVSDDWSTWAAGFGIVSR
jgi:hypothetical protein